MITDLYKEETFVMGIKKYICEITYMSIDWWLDKKKLLCVYIYPHTHRMEYCSAIKKKEEEENPAICDNLDGPEGHFAKWIS